MKKQKSKRPVSPFYTIAIIWLLYSFFLHPISSIGHLILVSLLSVVGYSIVRVIAGSKSKPDASGQDAKADAEANAKKGQEADAKAKPEEQAKPKYAPEVQAIVDEGAKAHEELQRLYFTIPDLQVKRKVREIMEISDKIVADAIDDPSDVPQIKKFLDYYLPTTIKLLNAYERMGAQGIEGENITGTMRSINEMLDTAIEAYKKLLDNLFANQAMDIETDISVMNTLLQREGFSGGGSAFQTKSQ